MNLRWPSTTVVNLLAACSDVRVRALVRLLSEVLRACLLSWGCTWCTIASTSTEAIPIHRVGSVAVTRMVANPAESGPEPGVTEAVLTVGWGAVNRVDLEPATCGDPDCVADHGYSGTFATEDFALRISTSADGEGAVERLLEFAHALNVATVSSSA